MDSESEDFSSCTSVTGISHGWGVGGTPPGAATGRGNDKGRKYDHNPDRAPAANKSTTSNGLSCETVVETPVRQCFGGVSEARPPVAGDNGVIVLTLGGNQIGHYASLRGHGNGNGRKVDISGITPLGSASDIYEVHVRQHHGATEARNGQFFKIIGPDGSVIADNLNVRPDEEQGLAGGDEHLIISDRKFLIDLNGIAAGSKRYVRNDDVADPSLGDNDGELDFNDTGCADPVDVLMPGATAGSGRQAAIHPVYGFAYGESYVGESVRLKTWGYPRFETPGGAGMIEYQPGAARGGIGMDGTAGAVVIRW